MEVVRLVEGAVLKTVGCNSLGGSIPSASVLFTFPIQDNLKTIEWYKMKVWYVAEGFDDEDMNDTPWDYDIEWDEVNLYIAPGDKKPSPMEKILMIGYSFNGVITLPRESAMFLREWPMSKIDKGFYKELVKTVFNVDKIGELKWN